MNKKYLPSALIMYLNYFIHGVGCSILGQAVIKEALAAAWGVEAMAITAISVAFAFSAGQNGGYQIAYVCAIIGGISNSFLDTGIYPAVAEIISSAPGVATMGIKFFIAIAQMLLPFVLGVAVTTTATGMVSYNPLFIGCGIIYAVLFVLIFLFPLPDSEQKEQENKYN